MAILNSVFALLSATAQAVTPSVTAPGSMWHVLILKTFAFVADYGWRIVVFTLLLKLVLSPLDFYQRYKMYKNQKITERLKPTMEKIQKQYGGDKQAFSQKQMELNRKEGYSYFSSCLPMIVTMVVFITLWISMQTVAEYMTFREYTTMYDEYQYVRCQVYDPEEAHPELSDEEQSRMLAVSSSIGQDVVYQMYYYGLDERYTDTLKENTEYRAVLPSNFTVLRDGTKKIDKVQASFLWIKNIWAPDVPWGNKALLSWSSFKSGVDDYSKASTSGLSIDQQSKAFNEQTYNEVMGKLFADKSQSRTNGYLVLPILVVLLSLGSQLLSMRQQKRAGQVNATGGTATSMKVMMVLMPIMMAFFALQYASIFSLYMVTNSATTLLFNILFSAIIKLIDSRKRKRNYGISTGSTRAVAAAVGDNSPIIHYVKGANPNAGAKIAPPEPAPKNKKRDKSDSQRSAAVRGNGRPDPTELMSMDMQKPNKKK